MAEQRTVWLIIPGRGTDDPVRVFATWKVAVARLTVGEPRDAVRVEVGENQDEVACFVHDRKRDRYEDYRIIKLPVIEGEDDAPATVRVSMARTQAHLTTSDLLAMLTNADEPPLPPTALVDVQVGAARRPLIAMTTQ